MFRKASIIIFTLIFLLSGLMQVSADTISINVQQDDLLDVVLTVGKTNSSLSDFENDLTQALVSKGVPEDKLKIQAVQSANVSAGNTASGWEIYDHTNYNDSSVIPYYRPYYNEVNGNFVLSSHISVSTTSGTDIAFKGYGSPSYKDFMIMPNSDSGKKTFDFTIVEGVFYDALDGAGFLFNTKMSTNLATRTMSGYLLFFEYQGSSASNVQIKIYKFKDVDVNNFHNATSSSIQAGYPGFTQIASYPVSATTTRKVKIEATSTDVSVIYNDNLVNFNLVGGGTSTSVPLNEDFGSYSFGPLVGYLYHGCGQPTSFTFNDVTMTTESSKRFSEVIREPEWRSESKRFIINAEDGAVSDFSDPVALGEILARLGNEGIHYLGWGYNDADGNGFITKNNNLGVYIDKDQASTDTYSEQVNALAQYIYDHYVETIVNNTDVLIYGKPSQMSITPESSKNNTIDDEWPLGKWRIDHNENYFANPTGVAPYDGLYLNNLDISFNETGSYEIFYKDILIKSVYVHRKPVARFNITVKPDLTVSINDTSYDPDREYDADKGIKEAVWQYKKTTDSSWTSGQPSLFETNKEYIVQLVVKDEYGVESQAYSRYVSTSSSVASVPVAEFKVSPDRLLTYVSESVSYEDTSYDPKGLSITDKLWTITKDGGEVYTGSSPKTSFSGLSAGTYKISLKVKNSNNVWSEEVIRTLLVVRDTTKVVVTSDTTNSTSYTDAKTITLSFSDEVGGSGFKNRFVVLSSSTSIPESWGSMGTNSSFSFTLDTLGSHYLHYKAFDYAGNETVGYVGPFTLTDIEAPTQPTIALDPDLGLNEWSLGDVIVSAGLSFDNFTDDDALVYEFKVNDGSYSVGKTTTLIDEGTHTVYFRVKDSTGNTSDVSSKVVLIDKSNPTDPSFSVINEDNDYLVDVWSKSNVTLTLKDSTDAYSGIKTYQYSINDGDWIDGSRIDLVESGTFVVRGRSVDNAGNISSIVSHTVKLDLVEPEDFEIITTINSIDKISVKVETQDLESGLDENSYRIYNGSEWSDWMDSIDVVLEGYSRNQTVELIVEVKDVAGNVKQIKKTVTTLNNTSPVSNPDTYSIDEDSVLIMEVLSNDTDADAGDTLSILSISTIPNVGKIEIVGSELKYTPRKDYNGQFSFTYVAQDLFGGQSETTVTVSVKSVNDLPIASDDTSVVLEDSSVIIPVLSNDYDLDGSLKISSVSGAGNGQVSIVGDSISYKPSPNFNGKDSFTYTVSDGEKSVTARVMIDVLAANDLPEVKNDSATTAYETSVTIDVLANDSDLDGDKLTVVNASSPSNGSITMSQNGVTYTPNAKFVGEDRFVVTISDGKSQVTSTVVVTVKKPTVSEEVAVIDVRNDKEEEPKVVEESKNGTIEIIDGEVYYTPDSDFTGYDDYTVEVVEDGKTIEYQVLTHVENGIAEVLGFGLSLQDERFELRNDESYTFDLDTLLGESIDLSQLNVKVQPSAGTIEVLNGKLVYTPNKDFVGEDGIVFTVLIDGQETPLVAMLNVSDAVEKPLFTVYCYVGWLIGAVLLMLIYRRSKEIFDRLPKTIVYIVQGVVAMLTICTIRFYLGYAVSICFYILYFIGLYIILMHELMKNNINLEE